MNGPAETAGAAPATDSRVGELMVLSVHPRYGFQHKDCGLPPPKDAPTNQDLQFTLELLQCFPKVRLRIRKAVGRGS